ncbi:hypothetical protein [Kaistia sp. UC242_56]|uniref:hypothetical protein n=1 Tax=Kaistia sp. UC242_56 TaxID=3374625 RepID=UPI00379623B1
MAEPEGFVRYVFAYTNRRPKSPDEVFSLPVVRAQLLAISRYQQTSSRDPIGSIQFDYATTRKKAFDLLPNFRKAVGMAQQSNGALVLGGIGELLRRTNPELIADIASRLDGLSVPVIDAMTLKTWNELSNADRSLIYLEAKSAALLRTGSIRAGISASTKERQSPPTQNQKRAVRAVELYAEKRASDLSVFVESLRSTLSSNGTMTPSVLAKALNDAGVPSARGKTWSFNAAKNLLRRLDT